MRDPSGLECVQIFRRFAGRDIAERTCAGTYFPHDHHGGVSLAPAFSDVWTACFFADGHKFVVTHDACGFRVPFTTRRSDPDPRGFLWLWIVRPPRLFGMALFRNF